MIKANAVLHTAGNGYWSSAARPVQIVGYEMGYTAEDNSFGELRVYFDNVYSWCVRTHGLIYTDSLFMTELQTMLTVAGLAGNDVGYSEQGMQGENYVSCNVGAEFISSYEEWRTIDV